MNPYLSAIYYFAGNFAIRGFALCWGQIVPIQSNTALFSLLGVTYGGNGTSNFGLPDLRGRVSNGNGTGPGLSPYVLGEMLGLPTETMTISTMPRHNHMVSAIGSNGSSPLPSGNFISEVSSGSGPHAQTDYFYNSGPVNTTLSPTSISATGSGLPFNIQQPYLTMTPLIATQGIFPPRN